MLGALMLVAVAGAADAQTAPPPVSLDRIRAELARTPAIDLSAVDPSVGEPELHFRVEVQGRRYYRDVPRIWETTQGPAPGLPPLSMSRGSPALVQVDLLGLGRQIGSAIGRSRRARAGRAAHEDVENALREFCEDRDCEPR
jgi:hypothetical protein